MYGRRSRFEMREERVSLHRRQAVALARPQQGKPGQKQASDNGQLNSNPVPFFLTFGLLPILPSHPWPSVAEFTTRGKMTLQGSSLLRWRSGPRPRGSTGVKTRLQTGKVGRGRIELSMNGVQSASSVVLRRAGGGIGGPEGAYPRSGERPETAAHHKHSCW